MTEEKIIERGCIHCSLCDEDKECYHKQLKQAENTVNECHKYQAELEDKIDRLEQENKVLKAQVDYLSKRETELISEITDIVADNKSFNEVLIDFSKRMVNQRENYYKEYNKYRSALEEIKKLNNDCADCDGVACGVCSNAEGKPNNSYKIANNVLGENNE